MIAHVLTSGRLVLAAAFAVVVGLAVGDAHLTLGEAILLAVLAFLEEMTDIFDGVVARRFGTSSRLGGIYDPLADSIARLTMYYALAMAGWISIVVPFVMTGRDIIVAYTRIANAYAGGKTSARISGKLKAIIQGGGSVVIVAIAWMAGTAATGTPSFLPPFHPALPGVLEILAAGIITGVTAWSLVDYLVGAVPAIRRMADM